MTKHWAKTSGVARAMTSKRRFSVALLVLLAGCKRYSGDSQTCPPFVHGSHFVATRVISSTCPGSPGTNVGDNNSEMQSFDWCSQYACSIRCGDDGDVPLTVES